jgi:23S rRNA (adenine2503-C2)-methyltransferase
MSIRVLKELKSVNSDSKKLVFALQDDTRIESVILPHPFDESLFGICVSVQVGCAVGCTFCQTGKDGLTRNLSSDEIIYQFEFAQQQQYPKNIRSVVFMGMGDSAHNIDNVLTAVDEFANRGLDPNNIIVSSVGTPKFFDKLESSAVKPRLAISLHSAVDATRKSIIPMSNLMPIKDLIKRATDYARIDRTVMFQWTLLAGINDSESEIDALVNLLAPFKDRAVIQIIPWNYVEGTPHTPSPEFRILEILDILGKLGFQHSRRYSHGKDIGAACGQLSKLSKNTI